MLTALLVGKPPAVINNQPAFVDEEHEVVSSPPMVNQIFPISLRLWFSPGFPPLALINSQIRRHLAIIPDGIRLSEIPDNDLLGVRRMSKLRA